MRVDCEAFERVDLFGNAHRAEFRTDTRADAAREEEAGDEGTGFLDTGEGKAGGEIGGQAGDVEGGAAIEDDEVALRAAEISLEDAFEDGGSVRLEPLLLQHPLERKPRALVISVDEQDLAIVLESTRVVVEVVGLGHETDDWSFELTTKDLALEAASLALTEGWEAPCRYFDRGGPDGHLEVKSISRTDDTLQVVLLHEQEDDLKDEIKDDEEEGTSG